MSISVKDAILELRNRRPIIIFDKNNENEGDIVFPSEIINIEILNFMLNNCKGVICQTLTEDVIKKLEIQKFIQTHWSDNSISVTHYYRPEELDTIKEWLSKNYDEHIKTVSFFPVIDHGFVQAPLEKITEKQYLKMISEIKPLTTINAVSNENIDSSECEGGCPVR